MTIFQDIWERRRRLPLHLDHSDNDGMIADPEFLTAFKDKLTTEVRACQRQVETKLRVAVIGLMKLIVSHIATSQSRSGGQAAGVSDLESKPAPGCSWPGEYRKSGRVSLSRLTRSEVLMTGKASLKDTLETFIVCARAAGTEHLNVTHLVRGIAQIQRDLSLYSFLGKSSYSWTERSRQHATRLTGEKRLGLLSLP